MTAPVIVALADCHDPWLVGGKAVGLARLLAAGFAVPPGICLTTEAWRRTIAEHDGNLEERWQQARRASGTDRPAALESIRGAIARLDVSRLAAQCLVALSEIQNEIEAKWAVRSSAVNEDAVGASFAGLYRTRLSVASADLEAAIKDVWTSAWDERVWAYQERSGTAVTFPDMAVVIQPMVQATAAGVGYSIHPVSGHIHRVTIDAVLGLGAALVDGRTTPDQFVVETDAEGVPIALRKTVAANRLNQASSIVSSEPVTLALSTAQALELARLIKRVERAFGYPVDVEWARDDHQWWLVQARPITAVSPRCELTEDDCEWSRANFKETMPELPSPMGLSFLETFMDAYIIGRYLRLGCRIPTGLRSVRVMKGRPYLNVTLFHLIVGQLGGDTSLMSEQLGGEALIHPPTVIPMRGVSLLRAAALILLEMWRAEKRGPGWFSEMKQLSETYSRDRIAGLSSEQLAGHLDELGRWLGSREVTMGIAAGVGQCLQAFNTLLPGWLGQEWRSLLNAALQGQGTVISAQQILRVAELVTLAREGQSTAEALHGGIRMDRVRDRLKGTVFLAAFDRYLHDYGHRGLGESDVMSPRLADRPETLLEVIRTQLQGPDVTPADMTARQRAIREQALATIRARCGVRIHRWLVFRWWYRRLCRFFSLRETNRHHLMYYSAAVRNLLLGLGQRLVEQGIFTTPEDVFFLTMRERAEVPSGAPSAWTSLVERRKAEREEWSRVTVPDTIRDWNETSRESGDEFAESDGPWRGLPISAGIVTGPARLVRSVTDWSKVRAGDILVASVIDPGMAPLFGLAAGLVVEMGGTLSHGAIIAREYGLPAVTNVNGLTQVLTDGDPITVDAESGSVVRAHAEARPAPKRIPQEMRLEPNDSSRQSA